MTHEADEVASVPDRFDLDRFIQAQGPVIDQVRRELREGRKRSHWMWYVFPQLAGLGHSPTALRYAIASRTEARAYLDHPTLGPRLMECTELVTRISDRTARDIFGSPDDLKFHSSMTLFALVHPPGAEFIAALDRYFGGRQDRASLELLGRGLPPTRTAPV